MDLSVAVDLIREGVSPSPGQHWADLGAGDGLFSLALKNLLGEDSTIHAIDKRAPSAKLDDPRITQVRLDFEHDELNLSNLDGIMMANSLHFVESKSSLLSKLIACLKGDGRLMVVEYDLQAPNPWVPFPITRSALEKLCVTLGFREMIQLGETPSRFNRANIYSVCFIR